MKTKEQTIELLETIARLLELKGENPFKIRAYTNAARALETFSGNFQTTVTEEKLGELNGIGDAITKKISEYVGPTGWNISKNCNRSFQRQSLNYLKSPGWRQKGQGSV